MSCGFILIDVAKVEQAILAEECLLVLWRLLLASRDAGQQRFDAILVQRLKLQRSQQDLGEVSSHMEAISHHSFAHPRAETE